MSPKHPDFFSLIFIKMQKERLKMYDVNIYFITLERMACACGQIEIKQRSIPD